MKKPDIIPFNPKVYSCEATDVLNHEIINPSLFSETITRIIKNNNLRMTESLSIIDSPDDEMFTLFSKIRPAGFVAATVIPSHLFVSLLIQTVEPFNPKKFRSQVMQDLKTTEVTLSLAKFSKLDLPQRAPLLYFPKPTNHVD